jgi:outer membrane protein assembly factor BamB
MRLRSTLRILAVAGVASVAGLYAGNRWLRAVPQVRAFVPPAATRWTPSGAAKVGSDVDSIIPRPDTFHAMHVDTRNSDEVWSVAAPMVQYEWNAEPGMYVAEGPTFDNEGNLYFSPVNPGEDVSLVSLDRRTGRRRWTLPGRGAGCGAPLILNDPDRPGHQMIFHSSYTTAMAVRPDGSIVWSVPTGLTLPERAAGQRDLTHAWGMNYHPQADALFGVTMDGWVHAHDRRSGAPLLRAPFHLPGAPAAIARRPPGGLARLADAETDAAFGRPADGLGLFTAIFDVIFGNGVNVANFYAIDPNHGRLYIAATAPDEQDGAADGVSRNGALYLLELKGARPGPFELEIVRSFVFDGGTGSTPTLSPNGDGVVVSDDNGNVIMLDQDLNERWRIDVGSQVAASLAVSSDNDELYAVTRYDIIKLVDHGNSATIVWRAKLDAYPGFDNFNALTPTITANGIVVSVAAGRRLGEQQLMTRFGMGLLDRATGELRAFSEGREESIAVSAVGPDGGFYIAGSPVRRAIARGILGDSLPPLVGGIQRYRPVRLDLLVRDAACAAAARADRLEPGDPQLRRDTSGRIEVLLRQGRGALREAVEDHELTPSVNAEVTVLFDTAEAALEDRADSRVVAPLRRACSVLTGLGSGSTAGRPGEVARAALGAL